MNTRPLLWFVAAALLVTGCGRKSPDDSAVMVSLGDYAITERDYDDYRKAREAQLGPIPDKVKEREIILEEMISRALLVQEAQRRKLDKETDIYLQIRRTEENLLVREMLRRFLKENPITDDDVKRRYDSELAKTHQYQYRASHILVKTEEEARDLIRRLQAGANFGALARQHSADETSRVSGGAVKSWINQNQVEAEFFNALPSLKRGQVANDPVHTRYGWHVVRLDDSRPVKVPPLEEIRGELRRLIQQERVDALVKSLKENTKVKISEAPAASGDKADKK
jgi:peptidyl-prolyl cis-trans isomerase C